VAIPVALMFATILMLILFIWGIPLFADIPIVSASDSSNLVSFQTSLSALLPWIMIMVVAGIVAFTVKMSGANI